MIKNKIIKEEILGAAKDWLRETIAPNHIKNTAKLINPVEFNINPFLVAYLARFLTGNSDPISIAKALIYPRVLGTSINTSFGQNAQKFTSTVLHSLGSTTAGIDIEFIDQIDGTKKYCQLKSGPTTINKDDVSTIDGHFKHIKNLARTNNLNIGINDLVVGVLYGERNELSANYLAIENRYNYSVYIGQELWYRLTGDENFYYELGQSLAAVAVEFDGTHLLQETIEKLAQTDLVRKLAGM
jgi:Type II restriction endonuclease EcoO109I